MRLWEMVHGTTDVVSRERVAEALERLSALEAAARQLGALEDVEEQRQQERGR
jgi:hypothetical protein